MGTSPSTDVRQLLAGAVTLTTLSHHAARLPVLWVAAQDRQLKGLSTRCSHPGFVVPGATPL